MRKMEIPKAPDEYSDAAGGEGGAVERCVAVRLAEVAGGAYLEGRSLFPGRAALKTDLPTTAKESRRKTAI